MIKDNSIFLFCFFIAIILVDCTEPNQEVSYEYDIQPIFDTECTLCHNEDRYPGNLCLTSYDSLMSGNSFNGPVVNPEIKPEYNVLIKRISPDRSAIFRMPDDGPPFLNEQEIDLIWRWIYNGAKDN